MTTPPRDAAQFAYVDVGPKIPNYTPGTRWGVQGKPRNLMQKPLSPTESIKHFVTPKGLAVRLYADESNFQAKPIAMNWDERGRLWVCETVDYPNQLGRDRDRIRICEDTNGDHVADQFTVFAEGLSIPTAILTFRGGAVVQNGTETLYLKDTDGDDIADQRTTLISDWALGDTHGGVSNFRYGLDNWIWAMQGYNTSTPYVDGKPTQTFRMGFWRFKLSQSDPPVVSGLEFIRASNNNTWGLGISEEGLIFGSTANRNPSMFVPIPNRYYERVHGWAPSTLGSIADTHRFQPITENVRQVDQFGGYTAGAGHALYTARAFPPQWWNRTAFVCGPTGHLVGTFVLERDGAGYRSSSPCNLLASDDEWSAPIMAEVGPDGAVWIIDWYNYIVQHNPTPHGFERGKGNAYESDLRDKTHGRIIRVVGEEAAGDVVHSFGDLSTASDAELVAALRHPSFSWRLQAQRLLIERSSKASVQGLLALVSDQSLDEIGLNVGAIHALHTLHGLSESEAASSPVGDALREAVKLGMTHPSAGVRRNALQVLPQNDFGLKLVLRNGQLFDDADSQVQLQAVLSLADMPESAEAGGLVATLAESVVDPTLTDALTAAAAAHAYPCLKTILRRGPQTSSKSLRQIVQRLSTHLAGRGLGPSQLHDILTALVGSNEVLIGATLQGLTSGPSVTFVKTNDSVDSAFVSLYGTVPQELQVKLVRLAVKCGSHSLREYEPEVVKALVATVGDKSRSDEDRIAAARDLMLLKPSELTACGAILEQVTSQTTPDLARELLQTVRASASPQVGTMIVKSISQLTPQVRATAVDVLLGRKPWTAALVDALQNRAISSGDLSPTQTQLLQAYPDPDIRARVTEVLSHEKGLPDADRDRVLRSVLPLAAMQGNVNDGREAFKKHCAACHKHGGMGKSIGPNLSGMSVHPKEELLTHIIDPSRSVEGNFRLYTVVQHDGTVLSGMLAAETRTSVSIIDVKGVEKQVQRSDIEELLASSKSVMPDGFEKQLNSRELTDLLEFLAHKGGLIPIRLDDVATSISTRPLSQQSGEVSEMIVFEDWDTKVFRGIPFRLTDPQGGTQPNLIMLGQSSPAVSVSCRTAARAIHLLSGVGRGNYPHGEVATVSMIVRLHYLDGQREDHPLLNGIHFADFSRRVDVPKSEVAFHPGKHQLRYLAIVPQRQQVIETIELLKGGDRSIPIVMALTLEAL